MSTSTSDLAAITVPTNEIPGLLIPAFQDTVIMVGIVMVIVAVVGVPLGAIVHNLAPGGLFENRALHTPLSWVISIGRSLPFLVLMTSIIPFTRLITGTNIGIPAAVVPMSIAGIAFFTRIVENSLRAGCRRRSSRPRRPRVGRRSRSSARHRYPRRCRRSSVV